MKARTLLRQKNIKTNSIDRKKFAISLGLIRRGRFEWRWLPLVVNHMKSVIVNWRDFLFHFEFNSLFEWLSIPLEFEYRENFKRWTHWNLQSPHQVNDDHTFAHTHTHTLAYTLTQRFFILKKQYQNILVRPLFAIKVTNVSVAVSQQRLLLLLFVFCFFRLCIR